MCGRYTLTSPVQALRQMFEFEGSPNLAPRYNVAPTQTAAVVRADGDGGREIAQMRWGLVPHWAKELAIGARMINARAETVAAKPSFRQAYSRRRCLVPADGYYEWRKEGSAKQPYLFLRRDRAPMGLAGLWERWTVPDGTAAEGFSAGDTIETFALLTTGAHEQVATIHHRMPLILDPADFGLWLMPESDPAALDALLAPPAVTLDFFPVSRRVNSPRNDDPACIEPLAAAAG